MKFSRIYHFTSHEGQPGRKASAPDSFQDDAHAILFDKLRSVFLTHARRQYGVFDASPAFLTTEALRDYHSQTLEAEALGDRLADQFQAALVLAEQPLDVYLWLVIDQSGDSDVVYLFLLQQDESYHIAPSLTVRAGPSLYANRLQYAARIHLNEWINDNTATYLSMLAPRNPLPQTVAWTALIGFSEGVDRAAKTEALLGTIEDFAQALPPEKAKEYRSKVVDYCLDQDKQGKPVELRALSEHVDEEAPRVLLNFLQERMDDTPGEIYTDRNKLRRYTRVYGRDQDLTIGFSTSLLGQPISYDENTETLTIRALPKSLKSQLRQLLKKGD